MTAFSKTICPGFDEIEVAGSRGSEWLTITQKVGNDVDRQKIVIRSHEAARDLHYALTRYIAHVDKEERS